MASNRFFLHEHEDIRHELYKAVLLRTEPIRRYSSLDAQIVRAAYNFLLATRQILGEAESMFWNFNIFELPSHHVRKLAYRVPVPRAMRLPLSRIRRLDIDTSMRRSPKPVVALLRRDKFPDLRQLQLRDYDYCWSYPVGRTVDNLLADFANDKGRVPQEMLFTIDPVEIVKGDRRMRAIERWMRRSTRRLIRDMPQRRDRTPLKVTCYVEVEVRHSLMDWPHVVLVFSRRLNTVGVVKTVYIWELRARPDDNYP
jgi:hypothetical protein